MKRILLILMIGLFVANADGQEQKKDEIKWNIQETSIVGAKLHVKIESKTDFEIQLPQIDGFTYLKTLKLKNSNFHFGESSVTYIKDIEFRCDTVGQIRFPEILVIMKKDTTYTAAKIVKILDVGLSKDRAIDKETGLVKIQRLDELDKKNDLIVSPIIRNSTVKLGDSIKVDLIVKSALSNKIDFLNIKNVVIDSTASIYEKPKLTRLDLTTLNGVNYKVAHLITVILIPKKKGKYLIDSGIIELNLSVKKQTDNDFLNFIDEQESKNIQIEIPEIRFKVKN